MEKAIPKQAQSKPVQNKKLEKQQKQKQLEKEKLEKQREKAKQIEIEQKKQASERAKKLTKQIDVIPISSVKGDNIVKKSKKMPWYSGKTLFKKIISFRRLNITIKPKKPDPKKIKSAVQAAKMAFERGYSKEQIKESMIKKGWPTEICDKVLKKIN